MYLGLKHPGSVFIWLSRATGEHGKGGRESVTEIEGPVVEALRCTGADLEPSQKLTKRYIGIRAHRVLTLVHYQG